MATPPSPPEGPTEPRRTCVGCRRVRPQSELTRIVRAGDGTLAVGRRLPGRGAWLCRGDSACLDLAIRRGGFRRSFRATISADALEQLRRSVGADQQG